MQPFVYDNQLGGAPFELQLYSYLYSIWVVTPQPSGWRVWHLQEMIDSATLNTPMWGKWQASNLLALWINTGFAEWINVTTFTLTKRYGLPQLGANAYQG
jgi:hypothetical protein